MPPENGKRSSDTIHARIEEAVNRIDLNVAEIKGTVERLRSKVANIGIRQATQEQRTITLERLVYGAVSVALIALVVAIIEMAVGTSR